MDLQEASTLPESQMCRRRVASPTGSFGRILCRAGQDNQENLSYQLGTERVEGSSPPALLLSPSTSVLLVSLEGGSDEIIFKGWNEASFRNRPSRHR